MIFTPIGKFMQRLVKKMKVRILCRHPKESEIQLESKVYYIRGQIRFLFKFRCDNCGKITRKF